MKVVILGGGFAGFSAAREFQKRWKAVRDLEVVLVDRHNFMLFTPLLPEAASGSVEFRHIAQPFRPQLKRVRYEMGEVLSVDEEAQHVMLRHPLTHESKKLEYDELVFALGATVSSMGIEGVERFTLQLKTLRDAERLRNAMIAAIEVAAESNDIVERDRLLRFAIVGGGFTGVEAAGELSAFVKRIIAYYPNLHENDVRVVLIQAEKRLLPHLPDRFGKHAARVLADRGVEIRIGKDVDRVDAAGVTLKGGDRYESRTVIWSAGSEPAPFVKRLGLKLSKQNAIETQRDFSIEGHPHLWAIGDCAAVPRKNGGTYAPLAQFAVREGPLLARNVLARSRGKKTKPFGYKKLGQMASLGDRHALAELPGGAMLTGLPAWLLWRSYYLAQLPSRSRKTRVALDWVLGMAYAPSTTVLPAPGPSTTALRAFAQDDKHAASR